MLMLQAFRDTWTLCVGILVFFGVLSAIVHYLRFSRFQWTVNARGLFWVSLLLWLVFMSIVMTLVDSPYLKLSQAAINMLFMVAAFVGLPLCMPPLVAAFWGLYAALRGERVRLSTLLLLLLGSFSLGAVTSNMHDILWCGIITDWYSKPYAAGSDLVAFYFVAGFFGLPMEMLTDYAVFGSCMVVMVIGELVLAHFCLRRIIRIESQGRVEIA